MGEKSDEREEKGLVLNGLIGEMPVFAKELVAGGVAGGFAKTVVAPLERVKILFQTRQTEFRSHGLLGSFTKIAKTEGLLGFYRRGPVLDLIAGSFAGGTAVLFTYPLDLVRTKLAFQVVEPLKRSVEGHAIEESIYKGIRDCFSKTYKEAGVRGLYRGAAPALYGIFPYAGLKFYFYEEMKTHVPENHKMDISVKLVCGSIAGLLGQTFTYPIDVVRRQMQVQRLTTSKSFEMRGTMGTLVMIAQTQGWKQLFSGLSINYVKVVPSVAIGFTVYDLMKAVLQVPPRDESLVEVTTNRRNNQPTSLPSSPPLSQTQQ